MIHWISAQHLPLIYSMRVNFAMFSVKTAIRKNEMTKTCKNHPLQALQLAFSSKTFLNMFYHEKKCCKKPYLGRLWNVSTFCILAERGRPGCSSQENCHGLNGLIGNFSTLHDSRGDNEMCWLLDVRRLTNPPDSVISSHKAKGSVIPQKSRIGQVELVVWGFGECFAGQNQCKYTVYSCFVGCEEKGGPYLPCKA